MDLCPKCERHTVEYNNYQQRRLCTSATCDWTGLTLAERGRLWREREIEAEQKKLELE